MSKKVVYRFVDSEDGTGGSHAPIVYTDGGVGSTTEMDMTQARNGLPKVIQNDQIVFNREDGAFYVGELDGTPKRVTDIDVLERFADLPKKGVEGRLYVSLRENIFSVWRDNAWKSFSLAPVSVVQCYGVSTYKTKAEFPPQGEENHLYLTQDGSGYQYDSFNGYRQVFGDKTWTWTKDEADARFAFKSDIPTLPTLSDLGGITPHDVDVKIQDAKDEADTKFATISDNGKKADADSVYTKTDADDKFLDKKDKPTLSSLGAISMEQAESTFAKKAALDTLSSNVDTIQTRVNTLSEYSKTTEMQKAVDDSAASIHKDLEVYAKIDDVDKALAEKADNVSVMKKTDMAAYALKGDIPTLKKLGGVSREEIESTYARKTNIDALNQEIKDGYYPKADIDTKLSGIYTKADTDAKLKAALPSEPWTDFAKKSELSKDFAVKSETYTKDELEKRLKSIEAHGVDLSGYLKENDDPSDQYLDGRIDKKLPDMTKYAAKDGLLKEVIQQDKDKGSDLLLDYFANKSDIQDLELSRSRMAVDHGILTVDKDGNQFIDIKSGVLARPELPIGHNPVKLFVNGVRYIEGVDFSFDATANRLKWLHTEDDGYFRITGEDELRVEYETLAAKPKAPSEKDSDKEKAAAIVAIDDADLETIRTCTTRSETAATNAKASETNAAASAASADASAKKASEDVSKFEKAQKTLEDGLSEAKKTAQEAKEVSDYATPKVLNLTLTKDAWQDGSYVVSDPHIKTTSLIFLDLQKTADDAQKQAFSEAYIESGRQWDGSVMLKALKVPTIDIEARFIILSEEAL